MEKRFVDSGYFRDRKICDVYIEWGVYLIDCPVDKFIIRKTGLDRLINVEHIGIVVPGPWIKNSIL